MTDRVFPLPRPASGEDARFTFGLLFDIRAVLVDHGYPDMTGLDLVELRQALFRVLYDPTTDDHRTGETR